jgi:hypothetical protein
VIEQTISFDALTRGMGRCVREWILPALSDPWARLQAEQLATLLDSLPRSFGSEAAAAIRADSRDARAALEVLGGGADVRPENETIDALMDENATLKRLLMKAADELREQGDEQRLTDLQRFFMRSLGGEMAAVSGADSFETLTSRDKGIE